MTNLRYATNQGQTHIIDGGTMTSPRCEHDTRSSQFEMGGWYCDDCGEVEPYTPLERIQASTYVFLQDASRAALRATASKEDAKVYEYRVNPMDSETYVVRPVVPVSRFFRKEA